MNERKKVLYLITKATWGGAQRYVYDLATGLPANRFEPVVAYGTQGHLSELLATDGVATHVLPSLGRDVALISDVMSFFEILSCIQRVQPDVIHLNSSKAAGLGALAARIAGVPSIVFTAHGWPFKEDRNALARSIIYLISWFTAVLSHRVIVVSGTDEALARRMWWVRKRIVRIPIGIGSFATLSPAEGFQQIFGAKAPAQLSTSTRRLITIAELTANKGLSYAIDAVAELSQKGIDCVYVIAGEGEERASLERHAVESGVADRIFFLGFVANAARYLKGFDVFILPSLKEGMPYVLLEAGAAGIPIAATTAVDTELKERFPHVKLVAPRDPYALADAISELSQIPRHDAAQLKPELLLMIEATASLYR